MIINIFKIAGHKSFWFKKIYGKSLQKNICKLKRVYNYTNCIKVQSILTFLKTCELSKMVLEDSSCCTNCQYAVVVNILLDLFHALQMGWKNQ